MINLNYKNPFLNEDDDDEEEDEPTPSEDEKEKKDESPMLMKQMEKMFFEKRAVYLWGVVDDKSCKEVVSKLLLLDAHKPRWCSYKRHGGI
jgi:ATP-dependent Clp protease, protease subunit